ncbi:vWA domain-containing protein [Chitinivibrio alkaliphilus]|uniref:VWFA domain-containing protein n=1 Tax=Chitinivibrio alkaliphilus ACht1 TaxID=1313304 RepID=U7D8M2_9BACT|nr:VWA domain-containing protein [Chitinivibrio alkaliphilus]ERP38749.1 hypothetical protein CALK_0768 [Chitinivibrio alkaliphilus ACht1]
MRFAEPTALWALISAPLLLLLFWATFRARRRALRRFGDENLVRELTPPVLFPLEPLRISLCITAWILLVIAVARPLFGERETRREQRGIDIMIALDISNSMYAEEISPNRIRRAQHELSELLTLLKGERVGLTIFAGQSVVQLPLTSDYGVAGTFIRAVDPSWISFQGTDIAGAIEKSVESFSHDERDRMILLISDGEEHQGDALTAAQRAADEGVYIYTIGVGSSEGALIPMPGKDGERSYKRDQRGERVITRLNPQLLEDIALETGGQFFHAETDLDLHAIYDDIRDMKDGVFEQHYHEGLAEQYQLFLGASILLLFSYYLLPHAVRKKKQWRGHIA